jgi:hypothetical protein
MNNIFQINWPTFVDSLLLLSLRKTFIKAWLKCLIEPIKDLHARLLIYRNHSLYRVRHNSQIAYMEAVLNDHFDNVLRRIRIKNVSLKQPVYFYEPEENKEVFFYEPEDNKPIYFYEDDELAGEGVDFVVCVPPILQPLVEADEIELLTKMRGQIDYYKLYSKNYTIIWVQLTD